jgi:hypothetical protein
LLALCWLPLPVFAGPPLTMDDPGILRPGQWEIIAAGTYTSTTAGDVYQLPLLDVSIGIVEDSVQFALVVPLERVSPDTARSASDFSNVEFGVKWRFYSTENVQVAIAPYHVFGVPTAVAKKGIGSDRDSTVVPLVAQYRLSDVWTLNGELAFTDVHGGDDAWSYGIAVAFAPGERMSWLAELYGTAASDFGDESLELRAGFDAALRDDLHLLFAIAGGVDAPTAAGELDAAIYLGVQLFR